MDSLRQLERVTTEVSSIAFTRQEEEAMAVEDEEEMTAASLTETARELEELKTRLLEQQATMKTALARMANGLRRQQQQQQQNAPRQRHSVASSDHLPQSSLTESATSSAPGKTCPMCEVSFPADSTSQEEFEAHVVDHFRYEEGETLKGFDLMHDAHGNPFEP